MTCLKCRNDAFVLAHHFESLQCLIVGNRRVLGPSTILQVGMFWTDSWIIQTSTDTVSVQCLTTLLLDDICQCTLQYPGSSLGQSGTVLFILVNTMTSGFNSMQFNFLIINKRVECSNGIRPPSNTRDNHIRQLPRLFLHLPLDLISHNTLEITYNRGKWVRPHSGPDEVVSIPYVCDPITHCLIDGILQCCLTLLHWAHLGSQRVHTEHIELLTLAVHSTHVYSAVQSQLGTNRCSRHTMLPRSCLGNDARLTNLLRQDGLSDGIVNFMCASMRQILPLQPNGSSTTHFRQSIRLMKGSGSTNKITTVLIKLGQEVRIVFDLDIFLLNLTKCLGKSFWNELPTELTESSLDTELGNFIRHFVLGLASKDFRLVRGIGALLASRAEFRNNLLHCRDAFLGAIPRLLHGLENRTSYNNTISNVGNTLHHLGVGNTKTHSQRQICLLTNTRDKFVEVRGQCGPCTSDARSGNAVDESRGRLGQVSNTLICSGGCNQWDV
mmetsp:Transcript_32153/g.68034  ORF Transcript_32153/g.68034 Transcript_32153/m.68034 type:complete len:497 (+) Transcript_32153:302-1792(+)